MLETPIILIMLHKEEIQEAKVKIKVGESNYDTGEYDKNKLASLEDTLVRRPPTNQPTDMDEV